ncbi:MAG: DUF1697 domain-containing protein [Balneolaceae bacterium]|nr:DUF1697 domain-containing protein [Balneolaceae bacterium]
MGNKQYIALLRGINVGGHRPLKMDDLRSMFRAAGHENVTTYIQSGNVIFDSAPSDPDDLSRRLALQIEDSFGYEVPVIVRAASEVRKLLAQFPFEEREGWMGYISFLPGTPSGENIDTLESQGGEIELFKVGDRVVYSLVDKQTSGKPLFSNSFIEKSIGMPATTRNLRTVGRIVELAGAD